MPAFPAIFDLADLDGSNGFGAVGAGDYQAERNGSDVAGIGDINGDGFDDVLSSAPRVGAWYDGEVALTLGTAAPQPALGSLGDRFFSPAGGEYEYLGQVAAAGDINGDGLADFIASGQGGTLEPTPRNYIVFGNQNLAALPPNMGNLDGSNGFKVQDGVVSAAGDVNGDGFGDLFLNNSVIFGKTGAFDEYTEATGLDGGNGFALTGSFTARAAAGDINGDGFGDIIVGNSQADTNGTNAGESYLVFGKQNGFAASFDPTSVDGTTGFKITGGGAGSQSGASVSAAGDVNGDGFDDVAIWSPGTNTSHIVFGKAGGFGAGINLAALDPSAGFAITGGAARAAGDINGDTLDDLIVGSRTIVFGAAGAAVGNVDATSLDGGDGFTIIGTGIDLDFMSIDGAGDINGDGFADIVVGASQASDPREYGYSQYPSQVGVVYFIYGHVGDAIEWTGTAAGERRVGSGANDVLNGAGGKDHLQGVGGDDVLIGGAGGDILDGGEGNDTVAFTGASNGATVDLAAGTSVGSGLGNDTLISIENILATSFDDFLSGNSGDNRIYGGLGADNMVGRLGNDTYVVDNTGDVVTETRNQGTDTVETTLAAYVLGADVENLIYGGSGDFVGQGNTLANLLVGGAGNDDLNGGRGADTMRGGVGDDSYSVDHPGDIVDEAGGSGTDTIVTTISYVLGANIENLILRGSAAISGTGNDLANVITGNGASNTLIGLGGDDTLTGRNGDDKILGGDGNDTLSGGITQFGDNDHLRGGLGDDTYLIFDGNDVASEAGGGGIDTVKLSAVGSFTLGSGLENLVAHYYGGTLTGNSLDNKITATSFEATSDVLNGMRGNDTLSGRGGADTFVFGSGFGHDRITDFASEDKIKFEDGQFADFADVMDHATQVGTSIFISYNASSSVTIGSYQLGNLAADDFLFS